MPKTPQMPDDRQDAAGPVPVLPAGLVSVSTGPPVAGAAVAAARPSAVPGERAGDWVGCYRLLEQIGEGGFGVVWLAERREPMVQRVALKIVKPGMDTGEVLARFEQERQALAVMNHPNVARVLDAGSTALGRPYFVMEHVPGEPITAYCDRQRLSVRQRLELFIPVCEAVQHAHHKGIIHRDIKPSNILVAVHEGRAVPKVIDFGVAKAVSHTLTLESIFTLQGALIGTPEYMSPEQAEMGATDVDTRTDVYSLGVVLYELLAGLPPFDPRTLRSGGYEAMRRVIREHEPPKPSTRLATRDVASGRAAAAARQMPQDSLRRELRRELDWIPLKAIRKDRAERYATPMDLAEDIARYLAGEALQAGPESAAYLLRKLARRHRGPIAAVAAVVTALVLGLVATLWQARRADERATAAAVAEAEQRRLAEARDAAAQIAEERRQTAEKKTAEAGEARRIAEKRTAEVEEARQTAEYESYIANLHAADAALAANEPAVVRAQLDACPERLRGWEWRCLMARSDTSLSILRGHGAGLVSAAYSPDGTRILTAAVDDTARIWAVERGTELTVRPMRGYSAAYGPDGSRIVTVTGDMTARVWDAASGEELAVLRGHEGLLEWGVGFSPDGTRIVTAADDGTARVWDAASGKEPTALRGHNGRVFSAGFSPDSARIVTAAEDNTARVWEAASGKELAVLRGQRRLLYRAAFSPDGTRIVTAGYDNEVRLWRSASGELQAVLRGHLDGVQSVAFSPDGSRVASASLDCTARIWDVASGKELAVLRGHEGYVNGVAFSPDGTRVVTASEDGTVRFWDAAASWEGQGVYPVRPGIGANTASFSPDGNRFVVASWDGIAWVRDAVTGRDLATLRGHTGHILCAGFSLDGTHIRTVSKDGTARLWSAASGRELALLRRRAAASRCGVSSPDGRLLLTASGDGTAQVWDAASGQEVAVLRGHQGCVSGADFSPDGTRIVTASDDRTARLWEASSGEELAVLRGHEDGVLFAAFSRDGSRLATGSVLERTARVWDATTATQLAVLRGHQGHVLSADFSPDGSRIATASVDRTLRVWDAASGVELAVFHGHSEKLYCARFSPDGSRIVTASGDGTARLWDSVPYRERYPAIAAIRRAEPEMGALIDARLAAGEDPATLAEAMARDPALDDCRRVAALAVLRAQRERPLAEAARLNQEAWAVVAKPDAPPEAVAGALNQATRAVALEPGNAAIVNTFGVAQYRAGRYEEAAATLGRSAALSAAARRDAIPEDLAFTAMAQWRLGRGDEARATLAALRDLLKADPTKATAETQAFLREAEAQIKGNAAAPK